MKLIERLLAKLQKAPKQPKLHRSSNKFLDRYPSYLIGAGTYGTPEIHDWNEGTTLRIGAYRSITGDVHIYLDGQHRTDWVSSFPLPGLCRGSRQHPRLRRHPGEVEIGSNVWLCSSCIILLAMRIGHGAVIAAGSMPSRDVDPYSIVAGNPAQHVRWRVNEEQRQALLEIAWWEGPEQEVRAAVTYLCSEQIDSFIQFARARSAEQ